MGVTSGRPGRLDAFTAAMVPRAARLAGPMAGYRTAVHRFVTAPSEMPVTTPDRSSGIELVADQLRVLDRQPRLLAMALRLADRPRPGPWPVSGLVDTWLAALRAALQQVPPTAADREAFGRQLAEDVVALTSGDAAVGDIYTDLAALLSDLDAGDPFLLVGFYDTITPDQFATLLERVYDAHYLDGAVYTAAHAVSDDRPDLEPMVELLEPLTAAFEAAAALDVLPVGFIDALFQRGWDAAAAYEHPGLEPLLQLLVFGDVLNTGNTEVTVAFSRLIFDDLFDEHTRFLWGAMSPYLTPLDDGTVVTFQPEGQAAAAAQALVANPEAAYQFLLEGPNQTLLLNRAGESWRWDGDGAGQLPSEVLEAGLLTHPLAAGMFDTASPPTAYVSALRSLIGDVSGRNRIDGSVARGLGLVLSPHYDSFRSAVDHNTMAVDVLRIDAATFQDYLARLAAHEVGLGALQHVWAGWSSQAYAGWAGQLIDAGPIVEAIDPQLYLDTGGLYEVHRLLDHALQDANLAFEQRHRFTFWLLDKATGLARSRVIKATRLGGPKAFLASEALAWAGSHGTDWVKDQIRGDGPADADQAQRWLHQALPVLAARTFLVEFEAHLDTIDDPVERERVRQEYLPVEPGVREFSFERDKTFGEQGWSERLRLWHRPTVEETVEVEFVDWPPEVMLQWIEDNRAAYQGVDARTWWLNLVVSDTWTGVPAPWPR